MPQADKSFGRLFKWTLVFSGGSFPILSGDPNLSRKPPKTPGEMAIGFEKNDG